MTTRADLEAAVASAQSRVDDLERDIFDEQGNLAAAKTQTEIDVISALIRNLSGQLTTAKGELETAKRTLANWRGDDIIKPYREDKK